MAHQGNPIKWLHIRHLQLDELIHGWWCPYRLESNGPDWALCLTTPASRLSVLPVHQKGYRPGLTCFCGIQRKGSNLLQTARCTARLKGDYELPHHLRLFSSWLLVENLQPYGWSLCMKKMWSYEEIIGFSHSPLSLCEFVVVVISLSFSGAFTQLGLIYHHVPLYKITH